MADLTYEERKRLRRLAEDARDACNRHYGPFVDAVAHPLNILALLDMAARQDMGTRQPEEPHIPLMPTVARLYIQNGYRRASVKAGTGKPLVQLSDAEAAIGAWRQRAELRQAAFEQAVHERDSILVAARHALAVLSKTAPARSYVDAVAVCAQLQRALASLA